ncbi:hypothetical protein [Paenibacillus sp. FJAT-26967]|uniref:hypothetical protein n=1 Tax=Paenibacillus sp. FJAT-26967 TaxID=1729690 RepID=UPI0015608094|nr:hypothetical protein [Paenibacillus sp. FJAT-26967]
MNMQNVQAAAQGAQTATNGLQAAAKGAQGTTEEVKGATEEVAEAVNEAEKSQNRFNLSILKGIQNFQKLAATIYAAVGPIALMSVKGAMEDEKLKDLFVARTGNEALGSSMFNKYNQDALKSGMDPQDYLKGTLSLMPSVQNTKQLDKANSLAARLSILDSSGNKPEVAFEAIRKAMSGDITKLTDKFSLPKADLQKYKLEDLSKKGDIDGLIAAFDKLLQKQNMGQQAFDTMFNTPLTQVETLRSNFNDAMSGAGGNAMNALMPIIEMLNQAFQNGQLQTFFNALSGALWIAVQGFSFLVWGVQQFINLIVFAWPVIASVLAGIAGALTAILIPRIWGMIASLWAAIPPLYAQAVAWMMTYAPIILIGVLIGALVFMLIHFGVTGEQVAGFIAGAFMMLVGIIMNVFAFIYNFVMSIAESIFNFLADPLYALEMISYNLAQSFGELMLTMLRSAEEFAGGFMKTILQGINGVLKGMNWLADAMNKLPGMNIPPLGLFDENNTHALSDGLSGIMMKMKKPETDKKVLKFDHMEYKNLKNEFDFGYGKGAGAFNSIADKFKNEKDPQEDLNKWKNDPSKGIAGPKAANMGNMGNMGNIGKVDTVGQIEDKVDIADENLQLMRELAEMSSIQNFVTLTPTVSVETGDINTGDDINTIVDRITQALTLEVAASAKGVYG